MFEFKKYILILCGLIMLTGCSSFGYGITEAILDHNQTSDIRICEITSRPFSGLEPLLKDTLKVLMVHGIGNHASGYSAEFLDKLSDEMGLHKKSPGYKTIELLDPVDTTKNLGSVRVYHYFNEDHSQTLLFYELLWSGITQEAKKVIAYDSVGEYAHHRADINNLLKIFSNETMPDPFLYLGDHRNDILASFIQSYCWMAATNWQELANHTTGACDFHTESFADNLQNNHYAFVTHSLGSRITIDGLQRIAKILGNDSDLYRDTIKKPKTAFQTLKQKNTYIFMLANQLPILQLGRKKAEVTQQHADYCLANGIHYDQRMYQSTQIISFNDPNDIVSYPLPYGFAQQYLDSRLCINIANVEINVAKVTDLLGIGTFANPLTAHSAYKSDARVVAIIAKGIGTNKTAEIVRTRCKWLEEVE